MKKWGIAFALIGALTLAACSTPTPEVIVVTATPSAATEPAPTDEPMEPEEPEGPDDGLPESFVTIISPGNGTQWNVTSPIEVTGSARDVPDERILIFAIDSALNILGQSSAILGPPNDAGIQAYSGILTAKVSSTTEGKIVTGSLNDDGSVAESAGVFVTYVVPTPVPAEASITITQPPDGAILATPESIGVTGTGAGLPENNVVVQATDSSGNVLAQEATTLNTNELGGSGSWSVTLSVSVPAGTTGRIIAFSPDPKTGGTVASAQINVTYGQP